MSAGGEGWLAEGLSFLGRFPLLSTMRPASLPAVLGPQWAVAERASRKLCAPPWPARPRTVPSRTSTCAGGSLASAVGLLPVSPHLFTLRNWELSEGSPVAISECSGSH